MLRPLWFVWLLCLPLMAQAQVTDLADLQAKGAEVSALMVAVDGGQTLAQLHAGQRLVPASLSKLFTAALALRQWGSDKTFTTRLLTDGVQTGNQLKGNLILAGGGDPGLVSERLWTLVGQLQAAGITQVDGDLVVDASRFDASDCLTPDRCQARKNSRHAYNAGLSAAGVNYGSWCARVAPAAKAGLPALVSTCPLVLPSVRLDASVATSARGQSLSLQRVTGEQERLKVSGHIGVGQPPAELYVSAGNASAQAGEILKAQLALAGIRVQGHVRVAHQPQPGHELARLDSLPLATLVKRMLDYSNNYMADVLTLDMLADSADGQTPSLVAAAAHLQAQAGQLLSPYRLDQGGVPARLASGSGLTTSSRLSAQDLVTLLQVMYRQTDIFPAFVGALTVPRYSAIGILRGPEASWQTQVMVKSGSLNEPYSVYGIAGYARTTDGKWLAFAALLNGTAKLPVLPYAQSMQALRQWVVTGLTQDKLVPAQ